MKNLETNRIILRKFTQEDALDIYDYAKDEETTKYLTWESHPSPEHSATIIKEFLLLPYVYAITLKETGKCIGCIDLRINRQHKKVALGYVINKKFWNNGYMSETLKKIITYCLEDLKANRVEACYNILNPASGRVMEKCGMKKEGVGRQEQCIKGKFVDMAHMAILAEDYFKRND